MRRQRDSGARLAPRRRPFGWLIPKRSPLRRPAVQVVLISRLLSSAGSKTLTYGAMVHLARIGGSQLEVSLLSASGAVAALIFGLRGGTFADSFPKRIVLGLCYAAQAALCFIVPTYIGTDIAPLFLLVFAVSILTQITNPAIKVAARLVASAREVSLMTVLLNSVAGIGSAIGTALLAPVLVKVWDIDVVIYAAGVLLGLASIRAFRIPQGKRPSRPSHEERAADRPSLLHFRTTAVWIMTNRAVATMILAGAAVDVLSDVFDSLQPVYVRNVLESDPANSIYIFAPGAIGAVLGTVAGIVLVRWPGERWLTIFSLALFSVAMFLFGLITVVAPVIAPFSPLRLLELFDVYPGELILAAGMIAILVEFGTAGATAAVQTYIQRRVPVAEQGATFGVQTYLGNGLSVAGTLTVGALATIFGTRLIFLATPVLVAAGITMLIRASFRVVDTPAPEPRTALALLWYGDDDDAELDSASGARR